MLKPLAEEIKARFKKAEVEVDWSGPVSLAQFQEASLPMVVACSGCEMTMSALSPTAKYDPDTDLIWCDSCADD